MAKKIGIIGGMGPAAGCDLYDKIISITPARCDQDHIHVILDSNINIADRTAYVLDVEKQRLEKGEKQKGEGAPIIREILDAHKINEVCAESPLGEMQKSAEFLEAVGCDALSIACVTGHYFVNELVSCVNIPFISITEAVANALTKLGAKAAAILATDGSLCGRIFEPHLAKRNIAPVYPNLEEQQLVMDLIYKYVKHGNYQKIGEVKNDVEKMLAHLSEQGADAFILGCTDLPIAFDLLGNHDERLVDSTLELAKATVEFAIN